MSGPGIRAGKQRLCRPNGEEVAQRYGREATYFGYQVRKLPAFSTDMATAWLVAEQLRERWGQLTLVAGLEWHCYPDEAGKGPWGSGETAPLAICRTALLATLGD